MKVLTKDKGYLEKRLLRGSIGSLFLKIMFAVLTFFSSFLFIRLIGAEEYGLYVYSIAWLNILAIPASLGLDRLLIREISVYLTNEKWSLMKGVLRWSNRTVILVSLIIVFISMLFLKIVEPSRSIQSHTAFLIAVWTLPIISVRNIRLAVMKGLNKVVMALLPEQLIAPLITIVCVLTISALYPKHLNSNTTMLSYTFSMLVSLAIGNIVLRNALPSEIDDVDFKYNVRGWLYAAFPMALLGGFSMIHSKIDIVMLGILQGGRETGIYTISFQVSNLLILLLMSVNGAFAPTIASLYSQGKIHELQKLVTKVTRSISIFSFASLCFILGFGENILGVFGSEALEGLHALWILCAGQFVNACSGSVGFLMTMTGHEKYVAVTKAVSGIGNLCLNWILIPKFGIEGAAFSTATSIATWNVFMLLSAKRRLGINSSAL